MIRDGEKKVLDLLTEEIVIRLSQVSDQEHFPDANPDMMDAKIQHAKEHVVSLRRIRAELEQIFAACLPFP